MRDAEITKRKLLEAATEEFAQYGIAGARVDRIAELAGCNKQLIYRHFQNKDGLFSAVFDAMVLRVITAVPIDAFDLPEYAGQLFDWYAANPEVLRLATWAQLERGNLSGNSASAEQANLDKIRKIREAQKAGAVTESIDAERVLVLLLRLTTAQLDSDRRRGKQTEALRSAMVESVRRLVAP